MSTAAELAEQAENIANDVRMFTEYTRNVHGGTKDTSGIGSLSTAVELLAQAVAQLAARKANP